jgi:hypothetical protein
MITIGAYSVKVGKSNQFGGQMASTAQHAVPQYLRVPAVAERFDVAEKTVWNWVYLGLIDSIVVGRSRRISVEAVQRFIDAGARKSA